MRLSPEDAVRLQERLAKEVIRRDVTDERKIRHVCGVDVSYSGDEAFSCAVILERRSLSVVGSSCKRSRAESPYIPGLFFLREAEPILEALEGLKHDYELLLVDGHGLLHPRRFGLACYIGLKVGKPTVGVGKSLLCGKVVERKGSRMVLLDGEKLGAVLGQKNPIYVSIGHRISLRTAVKLVKEVSRYRVPEPLRMAHINARKTMEEKMRRRGRPTKLRND